MLVQVNVRLPEPLALKLKHVSHMTDRQRQDLVAEALEPLLNAKLLELGYNEGDL
jgi:predicted DNA-binding protein